MASRSRDLIFTILGIDRGSPAFKKVADSADNAGNRIDRMGRISAAALGGTTAAAVAAGAGIAGALGGTAVVVGGAGLAIASSNQNVADSFSDLWQEIKEGSREAAAPLASTLLGISDQIGGTFEALQPRLAGLFEDSVPAVEALADGVDGLIREAVPGLEAAVASSQAPMEGVRDLLIDTGRGATDFFRNVSDGSESSATIIREFGQIVRTALGFAGEMLARLANEGAPTVQRLEQVFSQLTSTISGLSSGALPVLFGAAGQALNVLSGLLAVLGAAPQQVGAVIGVVLSLGVALKGMDAITFGGLSAELGRVKTNISEASTFGGKVKAGMSGLVSGFGLLGVAAGGVGLVLAALGRTQQEAAQAAAQHQVNVEGLAKALAETNGVVTSSIRATAAKQLQDTQVASAGKNVLQVSRDLGLSLPLLTDGYLGNVDAQKQLNTQLDEIIRNGTTFVQSGNTSVKTMTAGAQAAQGLKDTLATTNGTMSEATAREKDLADASSNTAAKTEAHTAALVRLNDIMLGFVDKNLGYRAAVNAEAEAHTRATEAIKEHGASSTEATTAMLGWEQSIVQAVAAAGAFAESQYTGTNASERARLKMEAQNQEILRMAMIAGNDAPTALRQMIGGMDRAALSALGMTVKVNEAGLAVVTLPNGKTITLTAQDLASPGIRGVEDALRQVKDKTVTLKVVTTGNIISSGGGTMFKAEGGPVQAGQPYIVGEEGPELIFPDRDGWVATASETDRLMSRSRGGGAALGGGGGAVVNNYFSLPNYLGSPDDLVRALRELVDRQAGGSAERFFAMAP